MAGASCVTSGVLPHAHGKGDAAPAPVAIIDMVSTLHRDRGPAPKPEKQLPKGCFRHFPHRASAFLQRKKVQIKDKKRLSVFTGVSGAFPVCTALGRLFSSLLCVRLAASSSPFLLLSQSPKCVRVLNLHTNIMPARFFTA